ncbi:MAG: hypothetical protein HQL35_06320 [Alphaproteobacteria bacterium]|nr:hypothetical protein [Alphaproteobacteria bacterium]
MSMHESVTDMEVIDAPWNKELTISETVFEGGFKMIRVRIREKKRFTDLELDYVTAGHLAQLLGDWAKANTPAEG